MQHPVALQSAADGVFHVTNFWGLMLDPWALIQFEMRSVTARVAKVGAPRFQRGPLGSRCGIRCSITKCVYAEQACPASDAAWVLTRRSEGANCIPGLSSPGLTAGRPNPPTQLATQNSYGLLSGRQDLKPPTS